MRRACLESVYELAKRDERVFFIGSDLGPGTLADFQNEMPDRFFMEGINEANIIGMAAGLALSGKIVYVNTIATFITRRCYEQIALDLCLHNANVRLIGNGGGLVYGPLGPTHQAIEDIGIMRGLPNMTVLAPADASEMRRLMPGTLEHSGPIYIRLAKGGDALVTDGFEQQAIGQVLRMREGNSVLLLTTGIMLQRALGAAEELGQAGLEAGVLHIPTLKPLNVEALTAELVRAERLVTLEEHVLASGLGSAISDLLVDYGLHKPLLRLGLADSFMAAYGSQDQLLGSQGLDVTGISESVRRFISSRHDRVMVTG